MIQVQLRNNYLYDSNLYKEIGSINYIVWRDMRGVYNDVFRHLALRLHYPVRYGIYDIHSRAIL